jgi:hypothetical protein
MKLDIKYIENFWEYMRETFETENLEFAIDEFDIDVQKIENLNELSEEEAYTLMHNMVYMVLNEFFSGDFDTMFETLTDTIGMPEDLVEELLDF